MLPAMSFTITPPMPVPVPDGMPFAHVMQIGTHTERQLPEGTVVFGDVGLWFEVHPDRVLVEDPQVTGYMVPFPDLSDELPEGADAAVYRHYLLRVIQTASSAYMRVLDTAAQAEQFVLQALGTEPQAPDEAAGERISRLEELLASLNLYTGRHAWTQLTTEQKELFADVLDAEHARRDAQDGYTGTSTTEERWWRD